MLSITPRALAVMRRVTAHPRLKPTSGLRIAGSGKGARSMRVAAVPSPQPGDRVVEHQGGRLFLGPGASTVVEGCELDARTDTEGRVQFILRSA